MIAEIGTVLAILPCHNMLWMYEVNSAVFSFTHTGRGKSWGWDAELGRCVEFEYSGCGGNDNRFERRVECEQVCADPCTLPPDEGVATENITYPNGSISTVPCEE